MAVNITVCPDCGTAFDTIDRSQSGAYQALDQSCPNCSTTTTIAIVNYPDHTYEVIGTAIEGDVCDANVVDDDRAFVTKHCGTEASIRIDAVGRPLSALCSAHEGEHRRAALSLEAGDA